MAPEKDARKRLEDSGLGKTNREPLKSGTAAAVAAEEAGLPPLAVAIASDVAVWRASGYTEAVYRQLNEISQQRVRLGEQESIVSLCQQYVKKEQGLWHPLTPLPDLLFAKTL